MNPVVVAEFDDGALIKSFGQFGYGLCCTPATIEEHVVKNPAVKKVMDTAGHLF